MKLRRDVQALRGIAVIAVVVYHADTRWLHLGYLGVDTFFVISGFVVAPLILEIFNHSDAQPPFKDSQSISNQFRVNLKRFYIRRFYRLMPALGAMLTLSCLAVFIFGNINDLYKFSAQGISALLLIGNFGAQKYSGDYFSPNQNPLIHTWSLSVEEQIYLILPLLLFFFHRINANRVTAKKLAFIVFNLIMFLSLSSFLILPTIAKTYPNKSSFLIEFTFYSPFTRVWQFLIGSILYLLIDAKILTKRKKNSILGLFSLVFIALSLMDNQNPTLLITILTILIIYWGILDRKLPFIRHLESLGDKSYSIYLWHFPIIYLCLHSTFTEQQSENRKILLKLIAIGLTLIIGHFSYQLIEQKFRKSREEISNDSSSRISFLRHLSVFVLVPFILFSLTLIGTQSNYFGLLKNEIPPWVVLDLVKGCPSVYLEPSACKLSSVGNQDQKGRILLVGDSHAMHYFLTLQSVSRELNFETYAYFKIPSEDEMSAWIAKYKPAAVIFSRNVHVSDNIPAYVELLKSLSTSTKVLLIGQSPEWPDQTLFMNESSIAVSFFIILKKIWISRSLTLAH